MSVVSNVIRSPLRSPHSSVFGEYVLPSADLKLHCDASVSSSVHIATGVERWDDLSGNGNDLLQANGPDQPSYVNNGIACDGISQFLKTAPFTLNQPETVYLVMNQVSWTLNDRIMDGDAVNTARLLQSATTPGVIYHAGGALPENNNLVVGTDGVVCIVTNGVSSSLKINNTTATTGDGGAANMSGFTLGASGAGTSHSNIIAYEVAIYSVAHDAATQASIIAGLMAKKGI